MATYADWYDWFARVYVVPRVLGILGPRLSNLENHMSAADDKVSVLVTDIAAVMPAIDAVTKAIADLRAQLGETGISNDSLAALDKAHADLQAAVANLAAAAGPPAPAAPPAS